MRNRRGRESLLIALGFEQKSVGDDLLAGFDTGEDDLAIASEHGAGVDFGTPELTAACGKKDPVAIMQVENRVSGYRGMRFGFAACKCSGGKHAELEKSGIANLDADLGGAQLGIEHGSDVADVTLHGTIGIGIQLDEGFLAELQLGNVVLVDVAKDPDFSQVGDGECGGGPRKADSG